VVRRRFGAAALGFASVGGGAAAFARAFFLRCRSRAQRTFGLSPRPIERAAYRPRDGLCPFRSGERG
jgi:hypothetical protein